MLDQVFPEYASLFSRLFCKSSMAVLLKFPTAQDIANVNINKLTTILEKSNNGKSGKSKALKLQETAKNSFGIHYAKEMYAFQIRQMIEQIEFMNAQVAQVEKELETLIRERNTYLETITGVSEISAAALLGEIGDITRFERANQLVAFAGLDVSVNQSGEFNGTRNRLSKRGLSLLTKNIMEYCLSRCLF